ncbi:MAG TPA: hypothetical protein VJ823_10185 [Rhodanobacteraceae bacterium]|nr:hypothetical protein [Rhodanobacteraceae bacterium]
MNIRGFVRRAGLVAAVLAASFLIVPSAFARVHVGIGISVPGVAIGVGNCWSCGYVPAPVYYQPVYAPPVYYPAPVYYTPQPVYYGYDYGYYQPYYPRHYHYRGYDRDRGSRHYRGGYYRHDHH